MKIAKNFILFCISLILLVSNNGTLLAQSKKDFKYEVSGTVKSSETKTPLSGVRITYKGLTSVMTDDNGKFTIKLPSGSLNLTVSVPGYTSKIVSVKGRTLIDIELYEEGFKSVYTPIVSPQGLLSPIELTNAWSFVTESNILSTAVTSDEALQGKVSGLNMIHRSGAIASGSNTYIRGINTMNAGIQPLYVVDGIPYENSIYSTSLFGGYFSNPLTSIDIKDIESVTVLKDGTSQYGVKGANGVVLIRTIKPQEMETKINFHIHTGVNFEPVHIPVLNAIDHKLLVSDLLQSQGLNSTGIMALPYMNDEKPVEQLWGYEGNTDYYRYNHNTNWQKEIYNLSYNQDYYMNIFGGDEVAIYALSIGYLGQSGILKSTDFQRFNTRFNSEVKLSTKFTLNANMSFLFSSRSLVDEGPASNRNPIFAALVKAPFMATNVYNEQGAMSPVIEDFDVFNNSNPYSLVNTSNRDNNQFRFVGNIGGLYKLTQHLILNGTIGVNFNKERERLFLPSRGVFNDTTSVGPIRNVSQHRVDRLFSLYSEGGIAYDNTFNLIHKLNAKVGVRYQSNTAQDDWGKTANTGSDNFKSISYGDPLYRIVGGQNSNWNWLNFYGTATYGYRDKYFLNYTMSADASSRYGIATSDILTYPSVSAAWLISGEESMKDNNLFDMLKLRAGYSLSGNDEIGNYSGVRYYVPQSLLGNFGLVRGNLVDMNIKPEKSTKYNVGLDMAFLNERLNMSIDVYQTDISDMVVKYPAPRETGFSFYLTNAGKMRNTGIDVSINSRILNGELKWDVGTNISAYNNVVTDLEGQEYITDICDATILTSLGQSVGVFYGYKTNGVYSTRQEATDEGLYIQKGASKYYFTEGDVRFVNTNSSDKVINENDMTIIGNPNPDLYGSFYSTFKYKSWDLNAFFTYSVGNDVYNYTRAQLENMSSFNNQTQAVLNRWKAEGDITNTPKAMYGDPMGNSRFSDRWIEDGSYVRLKSLTLSYKLPLKSNILRVCTFFASGDNLLTFTRYKGLDPEFALGQNPLYNGIDATFIPVARTLSLGVKLEL